MLRHLSLLFVGFILGTVVFGFINFEQSPTFVPFLLSGCLGVLVVYLVVYSNPFLNRLLDWKKYTGVRLLLGILWNATSSFATIWLGVWGYVFASKGTSFLATLSLEQSLKLGILLFCLTVIYNICNFAFYSYNQYTTAQLSELKRQRKQAELQLATLKSQLSPHFLFNCINSLSVLFHDNTQKAETFIRSMAKSYQYTLENCRNSLISVREELDFVESYAFLLGTRFGDAFTFKVALEENHLDSKIPPLTLQLLIENAVQHNAVSQANPIQISITGDANSLIISNNKVLKKQDVTSTGIGLRNITGRYKMLSKSMVKVEDSDHFTVTLPLVKNE
ncbi:MAG: histidine kinase [Bacteroidota bacterium]